MNIDFFLKFAKFKIGSLVSAEDFADKFNYQISTGILLLLIAIVGIRQYIFTPIQCWVPHEWSRGWEEFAENYCWVQNTYYADTIVGPPREVDERERLKINYYQWVPFVLAIQVLFFYLPHVIWKVLSCKSGTNANHIVRFACEAATLDQDKREKMTKHLSKELFKLLDSKRCDYRRTGLMLKIRKNCLDRLPFHYLGKRSGYMMIFIYLFVKLLYCLNCIGQIFLMHYFIQSESLFFGLDIITNIVNNKSWEITGVFPRVTWCDLRRKTIANSQVSSFMCVLPVNMLNEKIYIFLWFWTVLGFILTVISIITWTVRMFNVSNRKIFIKKYLRLLEVMDDESQNDNELSKLFIKRFLRHDGIFLLMMIGANAGECVVADVVSGVWKLWKDKRHKEKDKPMMIPASYLNNGTERDYFDKQSTFAIKDGEADMV